MSEPKVTLKNIKTFRGMDGYGVNADVYINGLKCLFAIDSGDGGGMNFENLYPLSDSAKENIKLLEDFIKTLPAAPLEFEGIYVKDDNGDNKLFPLTLEEYVNNLIIKELQGKEHTKFEKRKLKLQETAIILGIPDSIEYSFLDLKVSLDSIPMIILQTYVDKISLKHCKDGKVILNTNLEALNIKYN